MAWRPDLDSSHREIAKIAHLVVPYTRGRGVDIGSGDFRAFSHWMTLDNGMDFGGKRVADIHAHGDGRLPFAAGSLDFVVSSHYLEHVVDHHAALKEWWRIIRPGGHLVLYLPHNELYPRIGQPGANPDHKHDFDRDDISGAMMALSPSGGWDLVEDELRDQGDEYSFFQVYRKRDDLETNMRPFQRYPAGLERVLVARFGAYGDMLQAASILPELKAQGFFITMMTTPRGEEVLRHDPNIDEFLIQDDGQVPVDSLMIHVNRVGAERYDRVIHLTGAMEQTLLQHPKQIAYWYPDAVRRDLYGSVNYLERTHAIAGVPYQPELGAQRFWSTPEEDEWAAATITSAKADSTVMIALAGSSVHKVYPHVAAVVRFLLKHSQAHVLLVGGQDCQLLEQAIACELVPQLDQAATTDQAEAAVNAAFGGKRVSFLSGRLSIRRSLALAKVCDYVIGPETGVLNAVAFDPHVAKVVLLSHSSHANLTRDWVRTIALGPADTPCYPCHRLHYGWENCARDKETGTAACAADIHPRRVIESLDTLMRQRAPLAAE